VDPEGRPEALSAPTSPRAAFRWHVLVLSLGLGFAATSLAGCRNKTEEARQKAELTNRLTQFKAQMADLGKQAAGLRARVDQMPEDLPGLGPVRDDLHAVEEVIGVEGGRAQWLAGELDKAFVSGDKQQIEAVSKAIPQSNEGLGQSLVKVMHEMVPLERVAAQRRYFESLDAARVANAPADRKPSPSKAR
jgi:hypothetical protein